MTQEEELRLIRRVQAGEAEAFEPLLRQHEKTVYHLALRMTGNAQDAEDLAQEAFLKAYRSLGAFRGESKFSVWLYRIVSNVCLDHLRREGRRPTVSLSTEDEDGEESEREIPDQRLSPERLLEQKLTREALQKGLRALPDEQRQILVLRELRGLSYEEIGEILTLEPGTVKSRIFRARKRLCEILRRDGNIPDFYTSNSAKGG